MSSWIWGSGGGLIVGMMAGFWGAGHLKAEDVLSVQSHEQGNEITETAEPETKPAYMIVIGDVTDREAFGTGYAAHLPPLYEKFGGRYLAIGGAPQILEGETTPSSHVIAEWPSLEAAQAFWNSSEYDALRDARIANGWGAFDVLLVEGLAVPTMIAPMANENR